MDLIHQAQKQYEAFQISLIACQDRVNFILDLKEQLIRENYSDRECVLSKAKNIQSK